MKEEEKKRPSRISKFKSFFKKRWVYPAIYIAGAAILLTAFLWYQDSTKESDKIDYEATDLTGKKQNDEPAIEVNRAMENFLMPVKDVTSMVIKKPFYELDGKKEDQVDALVFYNNTYHPNTGVDIGMKNGETFDVIASLSGTVKDVKEDTLLGNVIEIEHDKGIVTQYQSVTDIDVKAGDQVEQGQVIAKAGKSLFNEEAGVHVHFEIRKDGIPVNPQDYFNKPLSSLLEADTEKEDQDNSGNTDQSEGSTDESRSDDSKTDESDSEQEADESNAEDSDNSTSDEDHDGETDTDEDDSPTEEKNTSQNS